MGQWGIFDQILKKFPIKKRLWYQKRLRNKSSSSYIIINGCLGKEKNQDKEDIVFWLDILFGENCADIKFKKRLFHFFNCINCHLEFMKY